MHGWMNGCVHGWMGRWADVWMDGWIGRVFFCEVIFTQSQVPLWEWGDLVGPQGRMALPPPGGHLGRRVPLSLTAVRACKY